MLLVLVHFGGSFSYPYYITTITKALLRPKIDVSQGCITRSLTKGLIHFWKYSLRGRNLNQNRVYIEA